MSFFEDNVSAQVAVIPKGTVINGNIEITGRLEMYGVVNGNIHSDDKVNLCGEVNGNIDVQDLHAKDSYIEGRVECKSNAVIRENTVVLGDMCAENLEIDGAVQGKLDIRGCIAVGSKAIVDSDIKAKSIEVSNGAAINGHCSLCYADISAKDFFPEIAQMPVQDKAQKPAAKSKSRKSAS